MILGDCLYELFATDTFKKDFTKLDKSSQEHLQKLLPKILENPRRFKPLKAHPNYYRLRFERYRLVYHVEDNRITLMFVRKRDEAYRDIG